jgi:hypothetical protein
MSASGGGLGGTTDDEQQGLDRVTVMARLTEGSLSQRAAAAGAWDNRASGRRLQRDYEAHGACALISKRRGEPSNRRLASSRAAGPSADRLHQIQSADANGCNAQQET